jgi:hypothetical protein
MARKIEGGAYGRPRPNPTGDFVISDTRLGIGTTDNLSTLTVQTRPSFTLTGTLSSTAGSATVTGSGTLFLSELCVGDRITIAGTWDATKAVVEIASDTSLTVDSPYVYANTDSAAAAGPSTVRFDAADGTPRVVVNDQGNLGIGTAGPRGQVEVYGMGAGDFFGCPVGIRVHSPQVSDAWSLVMSLDDGDGKTPGAAIWTTQFSGDGGATVTFSIYDGDNTMTDVMTIDGHGLHVFGAFNVLPIVTDSDYPVGDKENYIYVDAGADGHTVTLPLCADCNGRVIRVYKTAGAGDVTVAPADNSTDTINGSTSGKTISTAFSGIEIVSLGGTTWFATVLTAA